MFNNILEGKKVAVFHHFFKADCKGGGESLMLKLREELGADLIVGGVDFSAWSKDIKDDFTNKVWDDRFGFTWLHEESRIPVWRLIKRQLFFRFSPKIKEIANQYDLIIYSYGNFAFVPERVKKYNPNIKQMVYMHTPVRIFADQYEKFLASKPKFFHPLIKLLKKYIEKRYHKDLDSCDYVITNSENIKNRLQKHFNYTADEAIFPAVDINRFKFLGQQDYYFSYGRLEPLKRIDLIIQAFAQMPDKKLIICAGGPMKEWVENETKKYPNMEYKGLVGGDVLKELVGNCIAGVYIPIDEDAGMTQLELMSAGKPVIGVRDGGLIETIIDGKTGLLLPCEVTVEDIIKGVETIDAQKALLMQKDCENQAQNYSYEVFYNKIYSAIEKVLNGK